MLARHRLYVIENDDENKSVDSEEMYGSFNPNLNTHLLRGNGNNKGGEEEDEYDYQNDTHYGKGM